MTEFLDAPGGRIARDVTGSGPLVVLSHGTGDRRQAFRFLASMLAQAGYRVANADLRGHGESSMGWTSLTRTDIAGDLLALIGHLGGAALIVGHSISGGAATIAAATRPEQVSGIVEINPFTKTQPLTLGAFLRIRRYRRLRRAARGGHAWMRRGGASKPTRRAQRCRWAPSERRCWTSSGSPSRAACRSCWMCSPIGASPCRCGSTSSSGCDMGSSCPATGQRWRGDRSGPGGARQPAARA
jgi:pimeloyl-ACP methyl ester carboxylesterase